MISKEELGKLIQEKRKEKKITQQELAKKLFVSDKAISNWETGKNYPDYSYLQDLNVLLDLNINDTLVNKRKQEKKFKTIIGICLILLCTISLFLINYYSKYKNRYFVYEMHLNDEFKLENSFLFLDHKQAIIHMGNILSNQFLNNSNIDITLYMQDTQIFYRKNYTSTESVFSLSKKEYQSIKKNVNELFLKIDYINKDKERESIKIPLNLTEIFQKEEENNLENKKILLLNNGYEEKEKNYYVKEKKIQKQNVTLSFSLEEQKFFYEYQVGDLNYKFTLNEKNSTLSAEIKQNSLILSTIEDFTYSISNEKLYCTIGNCDNYHEILEEVQKEYKYIKI